MNLDFGTDSPGLLVSVRNPAEAHEALAGGADVIDVKEPARGPLGAADAVTMAAVVSAVNRRALVTVALGELLDLSPVCGVSSQLNIPPGVLLFKIGLAGCGEIEDWPGRWCNAIKRLSETSSMPAAKPVAVAYADWEAARAPEPDHVLRAAVELGCPALLIDTWNKSAGPLFVHWPANQLRSFLNRVREKNLAVVIAGSLAGETFSLAVGLRPNLVAVRSGACDSGRNGNVTRQRVQVLKSAISDVVGSTFLPISAIQYGSPQ